MKHGNTFPRWLLVSMALAMLILLAGGDWFYRSQATRVKHDVEANLQAIAELKVDQITDWRANQIAEGKELTESYFFSKGVEQWMANPNAKEAEEILPRLRSLQKHYKYHDVLLVDTKGQVCLSLSGRLDPIHEEAQQALTIAFRDGTPVLTDLHLDENNQLAHLSVVTPLFSKSGNTTKPIGAVVLRNNARNFLYPLIQTWPTPSRSAETLIVQPEGDSVLFLNNLRFQKNTALTLRIPLTQEDLPAVMAVKGLEGIVQGRDYRGVKVISVLKHIPDSPWYMVAKIDVAEAFAVWRFQSILILALMFVFVVASVVAILVIWQRNAKARYQALFQAEAALRESESRYHRTLDDMLEGCQIIGQDWRYLYVNDACAKHSHRTKEELLGHTMMEVFPGIETTDMFAALKRGMDERTPKHLENKFTYPDGTTAWFELSIQPIPEGIFILSVDITELKRAEEALRKSEMLNRSLVEHLPQRIFLKDLNSVYLSCNLTYARDLGITPEQIIGKDDFAFHPPELAKSYRDDDHTVMEANQLKDIEERYIAEGQEHWIHTIKVPYHDEHGQVIGVLGIFEDITEHKRGEELLRTSEAQLSNAMKIAKLGYWEYDVAKDLFTFNDHFYAIFRTTAEKVGGYTMPSARYAELFVHPDDMAVVGTETQKAIESTDPHFSRQLEHRVIFADGEIGYITVRFFIVKDDQGRTVKTYGANQDITERKRAEETLADSERKFRTIFNGASDGMVLLDLETKKFALANKSSLRMLGYSQEEFENLTVNDLHPPDELPYIFEQIGRFDKEGVASRRDIRFKRKDGNILYTDLSPAMIDLGGKKYVLTIFKDITERKRAEAEKQKLEAQLLQAQKMESVGRLAGGVAHDFNNMLGVIIGHAELAMMQLDKNEPVHQDLQEIFAAAQRSTDLTRQLLAFARKQIILPKVLDLNDMVSSMLKMLRRLIGEDIDLVWIPGNDLWKVKIDPSQIDQILANLVVNSRDAITGVGKITIETDNVVIDEAYCADHAGFVPGEYLQLSFSDNGCGMDKETLSHVFEPFFTTKEVGEGTGLGLATVYGIVKQNEGFVNIYSEPGQGTTFKVYLPRFKGEETEVTVETVDECPVGGTETVLLVEDEKMILKLVTRMLERLGYTVIGTDKPEEAIPLVKEHIDDIRLLITDLIMPGMNGRELAEKLGSLKPGLKSLFMSGYTANVIAHHGVLDEGLIFIQKPFSVKNLARKVRQALE